MLLTEKLNHINSTNYLKSTKSHKTLNITFIDLFSGIGGFHYALEKQGFSCVFASEIDESARLTYQYNFSQRSSHLFDYPNNFLFNSDITKQDPNLIPNFDILCAGFPCQSFSIAGYREGFNDKGRGDLIFNIIDIIKIKKPKVVLLENVKNLYSHNDGKTYQCIKELITNLGYYVTEKVLNTMEYGNLPQNRERLYILAFKDLDSFNNFKFPQPIKLTTKLNSIFEKGNIDSYFYYEDKPLFERIKDEVKERDTVYQWRRKYVRENKRGVSPTLTANMGTGGHNVPIILDEKGIRKLTPRECLRLQGFPESFKFPADTSKGNQYKQIGNSVSVPVIEAIAKQIKIALTRDNDNIKLQLTENLNYRQWQKRNSLAFSKLDKSKQKEIRKKGYCNRGWYKVKQSWVLLKLNT